MNRSCANSTGVLRFLALLAGLLMGHSQATAAAQEATGPKDDSELAAASFLILKTYCYGCHGAASNGNAALDVTDREALVNPKHRYVTPGSADASLLWRRIADGEMPPDDQPQPSAEEKQTLLRWIEAGAPRPSREKRPFQTHQKVLAAVLADLRQVNPADRPFQRYVTLVHLYNDSDGVSEFELRLYRAALAKTLNSLSWESAIVLPEAINPEQTLFRIDLRDVGWSREDWEAIQRAYPYGLRFADGKDREPANLENQLELLAEMPLTLIRADWLAVAATRPPLYHRLLKIPETDQKIEALLRVAYKDNYARNRLVRAGFAESGVSTANRLVERHPAAYGYYWKSFDFRADNRDGELARLPLGPRFDGNPFASLAFQHDGGELIFGLPNGLQGYMLIDEKGNRIAEGPIAVVRDLKETSGSPVVVNGISCMHCHQHGMIGFQDAIRESAAVFGAPREKVQELYASAQKMERLVEQDRQRFLRSLEAAVGPFLQIAEDRDRPITNFAEPIGAIARYYGRNVALEAASLELGLEDPAVLQAAIRSSDELKTLGLGPLAEGRAIKRSLWENRDFTTSPFQEAARVLHLGSPRVFLGESE